VDTAKNQSTSYASTVLS